jgi:capsular exopolysaccharide synthesis family protein
MSKIHQAIRRAERELKDVRSQQPSGLVSPTEGRQANRRAKLELDPFRLSPALQDSELPEGMVCSPSSDELVEIATDARVVALSAPDSAPALQYRELARKLALAGSEQQLKTVLIASASRSEGRTLTAINLSIMLAQDFDQKVLLLDADFRNPSVHRVLGINQDQGLAELLNGRRSSGDLFLKTSVINLTVLPAGGLVQNPTELLNTRLMQALLQGASADYDWVIVDSPPLFPDADAELLSGLVDGVLLVVQANSTPAARIQDAVLCLRGRNVLGIILNEPERRLN